MTIRITDLFPHQTNHITDYDRLYHTREYFAQKALKIPTAHTRLKGTRFDEMREFCGYRDLQKFCKHVQSWNSLRVPIPHTYLQAIGIDFDMLTSALKRDRISYIQKLQEPRYPKVFNVKCGPLVLTRNIPDLTETEAITYIKNLAGLRPVPFSIFYTDFLDIQIVSDKEAVYLHKYPSLIKEESFYSFLSSEET